jgi:C-terminal processing protease CtpA/Prc
MDNDVNLPKKISADCWLPPVKIVFSRFQVSSVMEGGPAAESGKVHSGDLLLTVNGVSIDGMTDRKF